MALTRYVTEMGLGVDATAVAAELPYGQVIVNAAVLVCFEDE